MTIYFVLYGLIGLITLGAYAARIEDKYKLRICCWSIFALILLVLALRHETMGRDLISYVYGEKVGYMVAYDRFYQSSWLGIFDVNYYNYESGFVIYSKLVATLTGGNHQLYLTVSALLALLPIAYVIHKESTAPSFSWLLYLGLPMFLLLYSGLRQSIAVGLCFLAFSFVKEHKPLWFIGIVLLAATIHSSSLLFLAVYPVYYIQMNSGTRALSILAMGVVFILRGPLFAVLSRILKDNAEADNNNSVTLFLVLVAIYLFCFIFQDESEEQNGMMNIYFIGCLCQAFGGVYTSALRVGYYFLMILILLLPSLIKSMKSPQDRILTTMGVVLCFGLFGLYSIMNSAWAEASPYYFFWESIHAVQ